MTGVQTCALPICVLGVAEHPTGGAFRGGGGGLGEGHLDRIEIGAVGRQEQQPSALGADCGFGGRAFMGWQIVQDDDVAWAQGRGEWVSM